MITETNLQGSLILASLNTVGMEPNGSMPTVFRVHTQLDCVCVLSEGYVLRKSPSCDLVTSRSWQGQCSHKEDDGSWEVLHCHEEENPAVTSGKRRKKLLTPSQLPMLLKNCSELVLRNSSSRQDN